MLLSDCRQSMQSQIAGLEVRIRVELPRPHLALQGTVVQANDAQTKLQTTLEALCSANAQQGRVIAEMKSRIDQQQSHEVSIPSTVVLRAVACAVNDPSCRLC